VRIACCNYREINKAFCGFSDDSKYQLYERVFQENCLAGLVDGRIQVSNHVSGDDALVRDFHILQYYFSPFVKSLLLCVCKSSSTYLRMLSVFGYRQKDPATFPRTEGGAGDKEVPNAEALTQIPDDEDNIGIVTGNWGCGAFGGDPELKSMIQWIAASQVMLSFLL